MQIFRNRDINVLQRTYAVAFSAKYAGKRAAFSINDLKIIEGRLPKRIVSFVLEWAFDHREELMEDWKLARKHEELKKIKPLI